MREVVAVWLLSLSLPVVATCKSNEMELGQAIAQLFYFIGLVIGGEQCPPLWNDYGMDERGNIYDPTKFAMKIKEQ